MSTSAEGPETERALAELRAQNDARAKAGAAWKSFLESTPPNTPLEILGIAVDARYQHGHEKWPGRVTALATIAIVGITTFYTCYAGQQVEETRLAIRQTHDLAQRERSPVIWVEGYDHRPITWQQQPDFGKAYWTFVYSNFGRSPAINVRVTAKVFVGPNALNEADGYFRELPRRIPEGAPITMLIPGKRGEFFTAESARNLSDTELAFARTRDFWVVVAGRFQSDDVEGTTYTSDFCQGLSRAEIALSCPTHNRVYEGQDPQ